MYAEDARTTAAAVLLHIALLVLGLVCGFALVGWLIGRL